MRQVIYRKTDLIKVGLMQDNTTFEWELEHNVIPNFGGVESDYTTIETNLQRFHLESIGGVVVAVEDGLTIEKQRQAILNQLKELDLQLMDGRIIEDIISGTPIHQSKLDIISQKVMLREELRLLDIVE